MNPGRISSSKSPQKILQLRNPLLQRKRTQSQVSYEGNTIDMVRIVRKNQQSRHSLMNIDRREYLNHQQSTGYNQWRHSENRNHHHKPQQYDEQYEPHLSSTFVHQGTQLLNKQSPQFIEHYIRASNVNLLNQMNQQGNNKVLGLTLFCVFLVLFSLETLACGYFLYGCHVIFGHFDYILVLNYAYYDEVFQQIEKDNSLSVLALYLGIECFYHISIWVINNYTKGKYKLIDNETSRLSYIMKCRDFNRNSHSQVQKFIRSPKFTVFLIILATLLHSYGMVHCYYYNQLNYIYVYFMTEPIIGLIEIFYFSVILPEVWHYLFFEKMHIKNVQINDSHEDQSHSQNWKLPQLTDFMIQHWWLKLALVILFLSVIYSLFVSFWLIAISLAKIEISFKKMKHKIDTFYLQFIGKFILLIVALLIVYCRSQSQSFITFSYSLQCLILITLAFLLTRVLANLFLRQQLYKYFYSEMNINIGKMLFVFGIVYAVNFWVGEVQYLSESLIIVAVFCLGLALSLYTDENHRLLIKFTQDHRNSDAFFEMKNL